MKKLEPDPKKGISQILSRTDPTGISFKNLVKPSQYSPDKFIKFQYGSPIMSSQNNVAPPTRFSSDKSRIANPLMSLLKDQKLSTTSQKKSQNNSMLQDGDDINKELEIVNAKCSVLINENQKLKEDNNFLKSELATKTVVISVNAKKIRDLTEEIANLRTNDNNLFSNNIKLKTLNEAEEVIIEELKENLNVVENQLLMQKMGYLNKTLAIKKEINKIFNEFNTILSSKSNRIDEIYQHNEAVLHYVKNVLINKLKELEKSSLFETQNDDMIESSLMIASSLNSDYNLKKEETLHTNENMSDSSANENIISESNNNEYELFKQLKDIQTKIHNVEVFLQGKKDLDDQKRKEMRNMIIFLNNEKNEIFQKLKSKFNKNRYFLICSHSNPKLL